MARNEVEPLQAFLTAVAEARDAAIAGVREGIVERMSVESVLEIVLEPWEAGLEVALEPTETASPALDETAPPRDADSFWNGVCGPMPADRAAVDPSPAEHEHDF